MTVVTHNGIFHADEVTAIALLQVWDVFNGEVVRTRDAGIIESADMAIDVGGMYDGESRFDHHQVSYTGELSSAGMIWEHIGLTSQYHSISNLVEEVDAQDTGAKRQEANHYCNIVSSFNTDDIYGSEQDAAFHDAVAFAARYLLALKKQEDNRRVLQQIADATTVETVGKNKGDPDFDMLDDDEYWHITGEYRYAGISVAKIPKGAEFVPTEYFVGRCDLIVQWDVGQNCWSVQTVPLKKGEFGAKLKLLESKNALFVHKAGFIGKYPDGSEVCVTVKDGGLCPTICINMK